MQGQGRGGHVDCLGRAGAEGTANGARSYGRIIIYTKN